MEISKEDSLQCSSSSAIPNALSFPSQLPFLTQVPSSSLTLSFPIKRKFSPDDDFFSLGNLEVRSHWLLKHSMFQEDVEEWMHQFKLEPIIRCTTLGCHAELSSIYEYEMHYNTVHRNVCQSCRYVLPSKHLLQLHLTEVHDPFFKAKSHFERMYECYVEGCLKKFNTPKGRRLHLVQKHQYPKSFHFDILKKPLRRKKKAPKRINRHVTIHSGLKNKPVVPNGEEIETDDEEETTSAHKESDAEDMDIESLTQHMSRIHIPKEICFGRGNHNQRMFETRIGRIPFHQEKKRTRTHRKRSKARGSGHDDPMDTVSAQT